MAYNNPSVADFKGYFTRDFPYAPISDPDPDPNKFILNSDISKAFGQTNININQGLFADQASYTIGYLLLAAHWLVVDIRMSSQGLSGQYSFLEQSKSVGSVSETFAIPQRILDDPYMSMLVKTNYGAKYLQLILPQLAGQVLISYGSTRP